MDCLEGECVTYLSPMGWPDIYSICFSKLDGDKDSLLLDGGFSFLIVVRLIRDNWKAVIENYPYSILVRFGLICRISCLSRIILFSLLKRLLGIILLSLLARFNMICRMWASSITHVIDPWGVRTGLSFWADARSLGVSLGLPLIWAWQVGLRAYFSNPIS